MTAAARAHAPMRRYQLPAFGLDQLRLDPSAPDPVPGPGQARLQVKALSLNYRDLAIVRGEYNPRLKLPAVPLSDAAGVVAEVGAGVTRVRPGDRVMSHFIAGWLDGPYRAEYGKTTLGTPGPGVAAEELVLDAEALVPMPPGWSFAEASSLPVAALTAWSALSTEGRVEPGQSVLTLGTGGVSVFVVQLGRALGARVLVTSSSDDKIERARALGAEAGVNYAREPDWEKRVVELTGGRGTDLVVETGGAGTLERSLRAVRAGGTIALLGSLAGLSAPLNLAPLFMRRIRVQGILVDSRAAFARMVEFLGEHADLRPVIDSTYPFDRLKDALQHLESGRHFGKIVVEV